MLPLCYLLLIVIPPTIFTSYCGFYIPKDESTCDRFTNSSYICCHLTGHLSGAYHTMCYPFSREDYYKMSRSVGINGYQYKLNCGTRRGASCGKVVDPKSYKDCAIASKSKNSCCYYRYQNTANCVWLGKSDVGTMKYKDLLVICGSRYYNLSMNFLMVMLLFIIM